ncbi:MAG: hypothetical protein ACFNWZ_04165 [Candidatus Absconditicoccaceae bacterium]
MSKRRSGKGYFQVFPCEEDRLPEGSDSVADSVAFRRNVGKDLKIANTPIPPGCATVDMKVTLWLDI